MFSVGDKSGSPAVECNVQFAILFFNQVTDYPLVHVHEHWLVLHSSRLRTKLTWAAVMYTVTQQRSTEGSHHSCHCINRYRISKQQTLLTAEILYT